MTKKSKSKKAHDELQDALRHCLKDFKSDSKPWKGAAVFREQHVDIPLRLVPPTYMVFLTFVGLLGYEYWGKEEKVAWMIPISYKGTPFLLSHRKFGFRVHSLSETPPKPELTKEMLVQLNKSVKIADGLLQPQFQEQLQKGHVTVANTYVRLSRM